MIQNFLRFIKPRRQRGLMATRHVLTPLGDWPSGDETALRGADDELRFGEVEAAAAQ
jgi:hypothetical protein